MALACCTRLGRVAAVAAADRTDVSATADGAGSGVRRTCSGGASARRSCHGKARPGSPKAWLPKVRLSNSRCANAEMSNASRMRVCSGTQPRPRRHPWASACGSDCTDLRSKVDAGQTLEPDDFKRPPPSRAWRADPWPADQGPARAPWGVGWAASGPLSYPIRPSRAANLTLQGVLGPGADRAPGYLPYRQRLYQPVWLTTVKTSAARIRADSGVVKNSVTNRPTSSPVESMVWR